jgi:hypothetical protein
MSHLQLVLVRAGLHHRLPEPRALEADVALRRLGTQALPPLRLTPLRSM